jgi:hypothetical protein
MRGRRDSRRPVHVDPDIVVIDETTLAGVQADPDADQHALGPRHRRQAARGGDGRRDRLARICEGDEERIPFRPALDAGVLGDRGAHRLAMQLQHGWILLLERLDEACRPLDVGEEEGDRA